MEYLDTAINVLVLAGVGLLLTRQVQGRIDDLRAEMDRRFDDVDRRFRDVDRRFDDMQESIDRRFDQVDRRFEQVDRRFERLEQRLDVSVDSIRSDLTRVALAVGAGPAAEAGRG